MDDSKLGKEIAAVLNGIAHRENDELLSTKKEDLFSKYWHFKFDRTRSVEWNIYRFSESLEMYKRKMRRWEEHHNGIMCVVECVRDQYLMPRIREFTEQLRT